MNTFIKKFSIILFVLLMAIWIYLLWLQRIDSFGLAVLMVATVISAAILYNIENIKKVFFKTAGHEFGAELEKVRDEVYAKAEEVKKIGEEIAEVAAFNITHLGRFAPPNLDELLIKHRDKLVSILENLKSDQKKIEEITKPINETVIRDLAHKVVDVVNDATNEKIKEGKQIEKDKIIEKTRQYFESYELNKTRRAIVEYLKGIDCYLPEIEEKLDEYEYFLQNKKLK